jgi:hypothetical protein
MDEQELRSSITKSGPVLPVVFYESKEIDGRKRHAICAELGRHIEQKYCGSLREACSFLWAVGHEQRAVVLAATRDVRELAELCGARIAAVAVVLREMQPRPRYLHKNPRHLRGQKLVRVQVWMEPQLRTIAQRAGEREGLNLSAFIREATYDRAQLVDGRAPLPGTTRAPQWIKPREKRNRAR